MEDSNYEEVVAVNEDYNYRLSKLTEYENQINELLVQRQSCKQKINELKEKISEYLIANNRPALQCGKYKYYFIDTNYTRSPTLADTYQAIKDILGADAVEQIKKQVDILRVERKSKGNIVKSISLRRIGESRKVRKDKGAKKLRCARFLSSLKQDNK